MTDLKGKKIGVATLRSIGTLTVASALRIHGLGEDDVTFLAFPLDQMIGKLQQGIIDAAWLTEPFITQAGSKRGARQIQDMTPSGGPMDGFAIAGWAVSTEYATQHPDIIAAFQRAIGRAQHDAETDRRVVQDIIPTYTKIPRQTAETISLGTYPISLNEDRVQRVADAMKELGYLDKPFEVKTLLAAQTPPSTPTSPPKEQP